MEVLKMTKEEEGLLEAIYASPQDHGLKLILADLYEDMDEELPSQAWRWLGENGKYPIKYRSWWWWDEEGRDNTPWEGYYHIPKNYFHHMKNTWGKDRSSYGKLRCLYFDSSQGAFRAFVQAFCMAEKDSRK